MVCTPGSLRDTRSRNSYPSIPGMCTSTSTSRHWPHFTRRSASSGLVVGMASYPISAITADNISSCAGSSSRMHGVNEDFGAAISTVFDETNPTMPTLVATHVPLSHPLHLAAPDSNCLSTRASRSTSVQKWFPPSHFGTLPPQLGTKRALSPPDSHASFERRLPSSCPDRWNYFALSFEQQFGWTWLSRNCC